MVFKAHGAPATHRPFECWGSSGPSNLVEANHAGDVACAYAVLYGTGLSVQQLQYSPADIVAAHAGAHILAWRRREETRRSSAQRCKATMGIRAVRQNENSQITPAVEAFSCSVP